MQNTYKPDWPMDCTSTAPPYWSRQLAVTGLRHEPWLFWAFTNRRTIQTISRGITFHM